MQSSSPSSRASRSASFSNPRYKVRPASDSRGKGYTTGGLEDKAREFEQGAIEVDLPKSDNIHYIPVQGLSVSDVRPSVATGSVEELSEEITRLNKSIVKLQHNMHVALQHPLEDTNPELVKEYLKNFRTPSFPPYMDTTESQYKNLEQKNNQAFQNLKLKLNAHYEQIFLLKTEIQGLRSLLKKRIEVPSENDEKLKSKIEDLEEKLKHAEGLVKNQQETMNRYISERKELERRINLLNEDNSLLKKDKGHLETQKNDSEIKRTEIEKQKDDLQSKLTSLEEKLQEGNNALEQNKKLLQEAQSQVSSLKDQLQSQSDAFGEDKNKFENKIKGLQEYRDKLEGQVAELKTKDSDQSTEITTLQDQLKTVTKALGDLQEDFDANKEKLEKAEKRIKSKDKAFQTVKAKLQEVVKQRQQKSDEITRLGQELTQARLQPNAEQTSTIEELGKKIDALQSEKIQLGGDVLDVILGKVPYIKDGYEAVGMNPRDQKLDDVLDFIQTRLSSTDELWKVVFALETEGEEAADPESAKKLAEKRAGESQDLKELLEALQVDNIDEAKENITKLQKNNQGLGDHVSSLLAHTNLDPIPFSSKIKIFENAIGIRFDFNKEFSAEDTNQFIDIMNNLRIKIVDVEKTNLENSLLLSNRNNPEVQARSRKKITLAVLATKIGRISVLYQKNKPLDIEQVSKLNKDLKEIFDDLKKI